MNHAVLSSFEQQSNKINVTKGRIQNTIELSDKAISELRLLLQKKYNSDFGLNDKELDEIGLFLLTALAEGLKLKM